MNKRNLKLNEYGISGKRYKELSGFCEQYPEWKELLDNDTFGIAAESVDGMPKAQNKISDKTGQIAVDRVEIEKKKNMIDEAARKASSDLAQYIIKSVCYEVPFWYLQDIMKMPCSRNAFYDARRYFFYLLDKKK